MANAREASGGLLDLIFWEIKAKKKNRVCGK